MKLVRSLLVVGMAALLPLMPVTAQAQSDTRHDASGDVEQAPWPSQPGTSFTTVPDRADRDITSTIVSHRKRLVRVEIAMRELTRAGRTVYYFRIKADRLKRRVYVIAKPGLWRGKNVMKAAGGGRTIRCDVSHNIDYVTNRVVIKVPRSCLGKPHWVSVANRVDAYTAGLNYRDLGAGAGLDVFPYIGPVQRG